MLKELSEHLSSEGMTHCLVCWSENEDESKLILHHICSYAQKPTKEMMESLINELRLDEDFNMSDLIFGKNYKVSLLEISELAEFQAIVEGSGATIEENEICITRHEGENVGG